MTTLSALPTHPRCYQLDGAVVRAAREHLGLAMCEPPYGLASVRVQDGACFLRDAEDESYDLLVVDLDMGTLVEAAAAAEATAEAKAPRQAGRRLRPPADDPTRDMYRVLTSRGVLVINEYSEEPPSERLKGAVKLVRLLRRYFDEVHQIRTTTEHNTMFIAPVERGAGCDTTQLIERAKRASASLGLGGIDIGDLLAQLPPNRHQVYA